MHGGNDAARLGGGGAQEGHPVEAGNAAQEKEGFARRLIKNT